MTLTVAIDCVRAELAQARDHIALAQRASRDLPSSQIDAAAWGERRQRIDAALAIARDAIDAADREVSP